MAALTEKLRWKGMQTLRFRTAARVPGKDEMTTEALFPDPKIDQVLQELWRTKDWQIDPAKDEQLVRELVRRYPSLDLVKEIRAWAVWMLKHRTPQETRPRERLRTWCKRSIDYRAANRAGGRKFTRQATISAGEQRSAELAGFTGITD